MITKRISLIALVSLAPLMTTSIHTYDVLVEGKAAYFLSTNCLFKDIYNRGSGIYGFEVTAGEYKNIYGFLSVDAFHKKGHSIGFCNETKVTFVELGLGLKYFIPFRFGDVYVGLGALPTYLRTKDCSPYVIPEQSKWGCGGIVKGGVYFDLPKSFIIDLFIDYAFVKVSPECCPGSGTIPHAARLNGCIFGGGLGYRFN